MQYPFLLRQVSGHRRCQRHPPCPLWLPTIHWIVGLTRRAPRNLSNTSPNALRNKQDWSHCDVAILYKSVLLAPGTPSRHPRSKVVPIYIAFASKRNVDSHIFFATSRTTLFAKQNKRLLISASISQQPCV